MRKYSNKPNKNLAFTLIELLAVIIVLAIIALIATPIVLDVIEDSKKSAAQSSASMILNSANLHYAEQFIKTNNNFNGYECSITSKQGCNELSIDGEKPDTAIITINSKGRVNGKVVFGEYTYYICDNKVSETENSNCSFVDYSLIYEITEDGVITGLKDNEEITNYIKEKQLTIPESINGIKVNKIQSNAFSNTDIISITILSTSSIEIEPNAFPTTLEKLKVKSCYKESYLEYENVLEIISSECDEVIDDISPTVTFELIGEKDENNKYINEVYIKINTSDNQSGIDNYRWCTGINCEPVNIETENKSIYFGNDFTTQVCVIASDKKGNSSGKICSEQVNLVYNDTILNGADPELDEGMIPVNIANDGSVTKANFKWYNYTNKQWANIVLVSEDVRSDYINAQAGTEIDTSKVLAYYVWVPRYRYQIFTDITDIKTNQDYNLNTVQLINVVFEDKETTKSTGSTKDSWLTHPAFTFGTDELNGIWVGKFETTGTASSPTILPNVESLRNQNVSSQFITSLKFANNKLNSDGSITHSNNTTYGINNTDAHMMKNMEWGAVSYLATSVYGQGTTEIRINNSSTYITGCAATTSATTKQNAEYLQQTNGSEGYYNGCENAYNTEIGYLASTTGNITGIYDMSGGAWEYVMAVMEDSTGTMVPVSGTNSSNNTGFNGKYSNASGTLTTGIKYPINNRYYDIYAYGTTNNDVAAYKRGQLGDATIELGSFTNSTSTGNNVTYHQSNWNKDYARFVNNVSPWFMRGGAYHDASGTGVFSFYGYHGSVEVRFSFRSVLAK